MNELKSVTCIRKSKKRSIKKLDGGNYYPGRAIANKFNSFFLLLLNNLPIKYLNQTGIITSSNQSFAVTESEIKKFLYSNFFAQIFAQIKTSFGCDFNSFIVEASGLTIVLISRILSDLAFKTS